MSRSELELEQARVLVLRSPAMIWRAGPGGVRTWFNPAWLSFTGRKLEEETGGGWLDGVHPDDLDSVRVQTLASVETRSAFVATYRLRTHDGTYFTVLDRAEPLTDEAGAFAGHAGSATVAAHTAVAASDVFAWSPDNLAVAGFDGRFRRVNPSWTRTLGWTQEELLARPVIELVHPDDREATLSARACLREGQPMPRLINRYVTKDGAYRWFEWRSVADVERGLVYAVGRDVTEEKRAEERLARAREREEQMQRQLVFADRMASVGTLAAGVAHEINNPLAFVGANSSLILEALERLGPGVPPEVLVDLREMAEDVKVGAERIGRIVHGLQTFARGEEEHVDVIAIEPVVDMAVDMTQNEFRHRARLVKDYGPAPRVEADEARLGQVVMNLLVNAAHALREGERAESEIRVVTGADPEGRAVIEVRDTGVGIEPGIIDRVFDPFFTTKAVGIGTGLGLSICHNIVTALGGTIGVESTPGHGATFRVVLPAAKARPAAPAAAPPRTTGGETAHAKVLVVDDEAAVAAALRRALREHDVTVAATGRQALDLVASGRGFDVVFCDLMMPEMSGMELFAELSARFPEVAARVVFVTGGAFTPEAVTFLQEAKNLRIDKPFEPRTVRAVLEHVVGGAGAAR